MNSLTTSADAAKKRIVEILHSLNPHIREIEGKRIKSENTLNEITKVQEKVSQEEKVPANYPQKMKSLYATALNDADEEEEAIRTALNKITEIRNIEKDLRFLAKNAGNKEAFGKGMLFNMLDNLAQAIPLFVGRRGEKAPPLCGAIPADPNYIAKPGDMVAAHIKGIKKIANMWILAEVVQFNPATNKYIVNDIEDEEENERYTVVRRGIVPLPLMRANPATEPYALYPKNSIVMALFPSTTCFYKAFVEELPTTSVEGYTLIFEDHKKANGFSEPIIVAQRYIFNYKDKKGKNQT